MYLGFLSVPLLSRSFPNVISAVVKPKVAGCIPWQTEIQVVVAKDGAKTRQPRKGGDGISKIKVSTIGCIRQRYAVRTRKAHEASKSSHS